jgi:hypothetical protein
LERLAANKLDPTTGYQVELIAQTMHQALLGVFVAKRERTTEVDEGAAIDACPGWVAIN